MKINEELFKKIAKKGTALVLAGTLLVGSNLVLPEQKESVLTVHAQEEVSLEPVNIYGQFGVNLYMDDKRFIPKDANGYEVYPFIVDGTTYVPLRAISDLFEADIKWDDQTKSIYITKKGTQAKLKHEKRERTIFYQAGCTAYKGAKLYIDNQLCVPTDALGNEKDIYIINGTTYVPLRAISTVFGVDINWSSEYNSVYLGRHKTEGLTVDNINDPETFMKYAEEFYNFSNEIWIEFTDEFPPNRFITTTTQKAVRFYIYFLNEDYCTEELAKQVLQTSRYEEFKMLMIASRHFTAKINDVEKYYPNDPEPYNFESVIIDKENADFLEKYQDLVREGYRTKNCEQVEKLVLDYFYGTSGNLCYENGNLITNLFVLNWMKHSEYADRTSEQYWDISYARDDCEFELEDKLYDLRDKVLGKQLVKK